MKNSILFVIILFSSFGAFAQVTRAELDNEIEQITKKVNLLQSENSKQNFQMLTKALTV